MAVLVVLLVLGCASGEGTELVHPLPWDEYLLFTLVSVALILFGGTMSGLTVGLMSLDPTELELKLASGTPQEQEQARRVLPVISKHHLLLVTLLVANAAAMEALPLFLDDMFATVLAVVLSVSFVLAFGEVIPQAMCTGPDQLKIASRLVPVVKVVEVVAFPVAYPIAKLLDCIFGHNHTKEPRTSEGLKMLVSMQSTDTHEGLSPKQVEMIHGAIDASTETVGKHLIPLHSVFRVSDTTQLTKGNVKAIMRSGFSRVPVHKEGEPDHLLGVLLVKKLLELDDWQGQPLVPTCELRAPLILDSETPILRALASFGQGGSHMAFITTSSSQQLLGIITLEDALEVVLKTKIEDETDYDLLASSRKSAKRPISKRRMAGAGSHPLIV